MLISHNKLVRRYIGYNLLLLLFLFFIINSSIFAQQDENIFPLGIDEEVESDLKEFREQKRLFQRDRGRENEFLQIIPYIKNELFPSREVNMVENNWIFTEAFRFSVHGFDVAILQKLKNRNIDILIPIEEITAPPKLANRVAISDLIVRGIVEDVIDDSEPQDGYRASIIVKVPEIISGSEFLHYRIILTNISDKVVSVWAGKSFSRNLELDLAVVNAEGKMVWVRFPRDAVYILLMYGVTLEPAESYTMDGSWNLRDIHGRRIPTGIYTLYGGLHSVELHVDGERTHEYDAPVGSEPYTVEVIR